MIGQNFRLGEIECAIGIEQLKKLEKFVKKKQLQAYRLSEGIKNLNGLSVPHTKNDRNHVYYGYGLKITEDFPIKRKTLCKALRSEGLSVSEGYMNIHLLPMYQNKIAFGSNGFPWSSDICKREIDYAKGICPIAEKLHDELFFSFGICVYELSFSDIDLIIETFEKVWSNIDKLKETENSKN